MKEFYCQYCGNAVALNSKSCPNCHKSFESILCPKCLYSGNDSEFTNGCPNCGYLKKVSSNKAHHHEKHLSLRRFITLFSGLVVVIALFTYLLVK